MIRVTEFAQAILGIEKIWRDCFRKGLQDATLSVNVYGICNYADSVAGGWFSIQYSVVVMSAFPLGMASLFCNLKLEILFPKIGLHR